MSTIEIQGEVLTLSNNESVLDNLLRNGIDINHSCKAGICQSCLMIAEAGELPPIAQQGLNVRQKSLNYFLSCVCKPEKPLKVRQLGASTLTHSAHVIAKFWLSDNIIGLRLKTDLTFKAGQFINLKRNSLIGRSYSIASIPEEGYIEVHIKHLPDGRVSHWIVDHVQVGEELQIQGPMGLSFYDTQQDKPMLLAGMGTGLAPLYGIIKDALKNGHHAPIHILLGSRQHDNFYLVQELVKLRDQYPQLELYLVAQDCHSEVVIHSDLYQFLQTQFSTLKGHRVYISGPMSFVNKVRKIAFLQGAAMGDISADSFLPYQD